ncbi:MAG: hypothetical protein JWP37_155 [Mucilaginibacter sp.]|nr:hypothetical protein [Mucilaginibacter sp.]
MAGFLLKEPAIFLVRTKINPTIVYTGHVINARRCMSGWRGYQNIAALLSLFKNVTVNPNKPKLYEPVII